MQFEIYKVQTDMVTTAEVSVRLLVPDELLRFLEVVNPYINGGILFYMLVREKIEQLLHSWQFEHYFICIPETLLSEYARQEIERVIVSDEAVVVKLRTGTKIRIELPEHERPAARWLVHEIEFLEKLLSNDLPRRGPATIPITDKLQVTIHFNTALLQPQHPPEATLFLTLTIPVGLGKIRKKYLEQKRKIAEACLEHAYKKLRLKIPTIIENDLEQFKQDYILCIQESVQPLDEEYATYRQRLENIAKNVVLPKILDKLFNKK